MSKPLGSILGGSFFFFRNGALANPSPLPTVTVCAKPNGTTVTPPSLTSPAAGIFYASVLFSSVDTSVLTGIYTAFAETSDATIDNPMYAVDQEIVAAVESDLLVTAGTAQSGSASTLQLASGASSVDDFYINQTLFLTGGTGAGQSRTIASYVGATKVATAGLEWTVTPDATTEYSVLAVTDSSGGSDDQWRTHLGTYIEPEAGWYVQRIKAKTDTIGGGSTSFNQPVNQQTGETTLTAGSSYMEDDEYQLIYTFVGWPALNIGDPVYWHAQRSRGGPLSAVGIVTAIDEVQFELTADQTRYLLTGFYSISLDSANNNPLRTPNQSLVILASG